MLGHLDALTFTFEHGGHPIDCVLIYAEPDSDGQYCFRVAAESGYEGIACIDDTARAALLALGIYEATGSARALRLAQRWLTFVTYMQYADGSFANFIRNGAGIRNASGPTSYRGGQAWTTRALWALARGFRLTGDRSYLEAHQRCHIAAPDDLKMSALLALGDLELYAAQPGEELRQRIIERIEPIVASARPYFRDVPESEALQLWGYHQLHAVAAAAQALDRPDWLPACVRTVDTLVEPNVRAGFWYSFPDLRTDGVCAYTVSPFIQGLGALYQATGDERYRRLALRGSAWFYGRNAARTPMYDPTTGRCRDGITGGIASKNYGAESSIEAGMAELVRRQLAQ